MSIVADVQAEANARLQSQIEQLQAAEHAGMKEQAYQKLAEKEQSLADLQAEIAADRAEVASAFPTAPAQEAPVTEPVQG